MKKLFIAALLALCAVAVNAQTAATHWIYEDFSSYRADGDYKTTNITTVPCNVILKRNAELEAAAGNTTANDGKSTSTMSLLVADKGKNGYAEFTIPEGCGVGTIRIHVKAKGDKNDRTAIITVSGTGITTTNTNVSNLGLTSGKAFEITTAQGNTYASRTIRVASSNNDPVFINTIQVSKLLPTIIVSKTSIIGLNYVYNSGPSSTQSFTVSGTNLYEMITIEAPANYEISKSATSGFGSSLTIARNGTNQSASPGTVLNTTIYVRLKANLAVGTYNSQKIKIYTRTKTPTNGSTLVEVTSATKEVTLSGSVSCITPTITFDNTLPATTTYSVGATINAKATASNGATVSYKTSNENVATVNPTSGLITITGTGYVQITASVADNSNYCYTPTAIVYDLSVVEPLPIIYELEVSEGETVSFDDAKWTKKVGDVVTEDATIDENNDYIQKITINGKAIIPSGNYKTDNLEIGASGNLDIQAGALTVAEDFVIVSTDIAAGNLEVANSATLNAGNYKVKKDFLNTVWYHIAFPFKVTKVTDSEGTAYTISDGTGKGVHGKFYNTERRADLSTASGNWTALAKGTTTLEKNVGYQFGQSLNPKGDGKQRTTLYFTADKADFKYAYTIVDKKHHSVTSTPDAKSELHTGWNLISNPYTTNYHLESIHKNDYVTYVYDMNEDDYEEDARFVAPFTAFFVQVGVDDEILSFEKEGCPKYRGDNQRALSLVNINDNIILGLSKDKSFTDYYRIRLTDKYGVSEGYDFNIDAIKMLTTTVPQLYRTTSYVNYAIDVMPYTVKTLPLTYYVPSAGNYIISNNEPSKNIVKLLLIDKKADKTIDLLETPEYVFTTTKAETINNRFELQFELLVDNFFTTSIEEFNNNDDNIKLVTNENEKQIMLFGLNEASSVSIFDLAGKQIAEYANVVNAQTLSIDYNGLFVVKVKNETQIANIKTII
jgi:hypothetical protein